MAANMQKIKLLKLYELLRKETDEAHPISRVELCRRLNEMGISSNVRTLSLDIEVMQENGFEIMSYLKDKEKFYYIPEHELTVPEIKILIDAVQAASFITEKKTAELIEKVAALGGSHQAELLKETWYASIPESTPTRPFSTRWMALRMPLFAGRRSNSTTSI